MGSVQLTGKGRRWLLKGHRWVYRDDIAVGEGEPGELLPVQDPNGNPLGWGLYSSASKIAVRMISDETEQPKREFWAARVRRAIAARQRMGLLHPDGACRLIAGDADGLPGFIVDLYSRVAVAASSAQASDRMRDFLLELLVEELPFELDAIVERSDATIRRLEELTTRVELLQGEFESPLIIHEDGLQYEVDVYEGHKTGHYLDQRLNRQRAAEFAKDKKVLDAFCYDGLFGIRAALAGASEVVCVDQSAPAGERVVRNAERNGVSDRLRFEKGNCMQDLRNRAEAGEQYGVVIVDPPAFARNKRELAGSERGYVELNRRAMDLIEPGGMLVSASCSYNVRPELFMQFLAKAARSAGREVYLHEMRGASPDHPYLLALPETNYLKCAFLRVE